MTRRQSGLSLIEVMFALSILAVAFLALFSSMLSSSRLTVSSNEDIQALQFAQDKIEEIKTAFGQTGLQSPGASTNIQFLNAYQNRNYPLYSTPAGASIADPSPSTQYDLSQSLTAAVSSYNGGGATVTTLGGPPSPDYVLPAGTYAPTSNTTHDQHGQLGWATPDMVNKEFQTRLKNAVCSIHFMSAGEYYAATGLSSATSVANIDLTTTYSGGGTNINNVVTPNYSFFPVRVTVTWTSADNTQRSVSVVSAIYNPTANSPTVQMGRYAP